MAYDDKISCAVCGDDIRGAQDRLLELLTVHLQYHILLALGVPLKRSEHG